MTTPHLDRAPIDYFPQPVLIRRGDSIIAGLLKGYRISHSRRCGKRYLAEVSFPDGETVLFKLTDIVEET